jgi:lipoate-protein ligase B
MLKGKQSTSLATDKTCPSPRTMVCDLGLVDYENALAIQEDIGRRRSQNKMPDVILLLEHKPTVTIGRFVKCDQEETELKVSPEELDEKGIQLIRTDRGGRLTYHGPGQLVAYPIINLRERHLTVRSYVRRLEEGMIRTLSEYNIGATRQDGLVGVWVGEEKIGSIGLRIEKWVSRHGLALNVNNDTSAFDYIVPCGIAQARITSMSKVLGRNIEMAEVKRRLVKNLDL